MVGSCVAPGCTNYYSPRRNVSYFRFPNASKYPELHKAWLSAMNKEDYKPSRHSCVCELHFSEDDYDETYKMKKLLMPSDYFRPVLKQDAVPKLQLQGVGLKSQNNREILKELLGDSYVEWKGAPAKATIEQVKIKTEKIERERPIFNISDFVLKRALKPLPEALQRIIPSILSVIIKEDPSQKEEIEERTEMKKFSCSTDIPSPQFYCCNNCNFTTFLKVHLLNHTRTAHRPIDTHEIFRLPMKIYKHKDPKQYTCTNCDFFTFSRLVLLRHAYKTKEFHLLRQIEVKWFTCEHCAYKSRRNIGLKKHMLSRHTSDIPRGKKRFECDHCDYSNEKERNLRKHLIRQHSYHERKSFQCQICLYKSFEEANMVKHIEEKHPKKNYKFQCSQCEYSTKYKHLMTRHVMARHTPESEIQWFECEQCEFRTKYKISFKGHVRKKHGPRQAED